VRRLAVAVDAVHRADRVFGRVIVKIFISIDRSCSRCQVGDAHPRDDLPLGVGRDVFDLLVPADVPVDAVGRTVGAAVPDLQQQPHGEGRVRVVGEVVVKGAVDSCR
jgi:hypothetical protein